MHYVWAANPTIKSSYMKSQHGSSQRMMREQSHSCDATASFPMRVMPGPAVNDLTARKTQYQGTQQRSSTVIASKLAVKEVLIICTWKGGRGSVVLACTSRIAELNPQGCTIHQVFTILTQSKHMHSQNQLFTPNTNTFHEFSLVITTISKKQNVQYSRTSIYRIAR